MARERAARQRELGPWPVGQRHEGQRQPLQRVAIEADQNVVGQGGQGMDQRLAGMTLRIEIELVHQRGQRRAQHRHLVRRRRQARTGPHAGMDGERLDLLALAHRHDDEIEQHQAMDARQAVGLDDERVALAFLEPGEGGVERGGCDQRLVMPGADAERGMAAAVAMDDFVTGQGEMARQEPAQQRRAFLIGDGVGIGLHRGLHRCPVGNGGAHVGQRFGQRLFERAARFRVGPVRLDIDHRFAAGAGRVIIQDRGERAFAVAGDRQDGMEQPVDGDVGGGQRIGDRIDQERHVVVDQRDPHEAAIGAFAQRFDGDGGLSRLTPIGGAAHEQRGGGQRRFVEPFPLARQRATRQRRFQRLTDARINFLDLRVSQRRHSPTSHQRVHSRFHGTEERLDAAMRLPGLGSPLCLRLNGGSTQAVE